MSGWSISLYHKLAACFGRQPRSNLDTWPELAPLSYLNDHQLDDIGLIRLDELGLIRFSGSERHIHEDDMGQELVGILVVGGAVAEADGPAQSDRFDEQIGGVESHERIAVASRGIDRCEA
ncbi:hypothetical protein [Mesorhizobium waimense]|uniref:hypothetical protein n=1 Tax=Mesorhizobium waimense TaxID=1300307 RepID=UPI0011C4608E|nr:hypothetical protein [Mesorhizobium waimense]